MEAASYHTGEFPCEAVDSLLRQNQPGGVAVYSYSFLFGNNSVGNGLIRFDDPNPVIRELRMSPWQGDLRHVASNALLLTHRTGRSRAGCGFGLTPDSEVTRQAF